MRRKYREHGFSRRRYDTIWRGGSLQCYQMRTLQVQFLPDWCKVCKVQPPVQTVWNSHWKMRRVVQLLYSNVHCSWSWCKSSAWLYRPCVDWSVYWAVAKMGAHGFLWKCLWPATSLRERMGQETYLCDLDRSWWNPWHNFKIRAWQRIEQIEKGNCKWALA
mgnify:CR=1 FL=1